MGLESMLKKSPPPSPKTKQVYGAVRSSARGRCAPPSPEIRSSTTSIPTEGLRASPPLPLSSSLFSQLAKDRPPYRVVVERVDGFPPIRRSCRSNGALCEPPPSRLAAARVAALRAEVLDHLELAAPDGEQLGACGGGQGKLLHSGCEQLLGGVGALGVIELRMAVRLKQHAPVRLWLRLRLRLPIGACVLWEAGLRNRSHRAGQVGSRDALRLRVAALDLIVSIQRLADVSAEDEVVLLLRQHRRREQGVRLVASTRLARENDVIHAVLVVVCN
mmetsp:Transcript_23460/g.69646  ORF Transcript_23460/g.69646 Transcript_23460/m.69646 type:complete len:275 (+) Transcript_23460:1-825(+)